MMAVVGLALILVALTLGAYSSALFVWQWVARPPTQSSGLILLIALTVLFASVFLYLRRRIPKLPSYPRPWMLRVLPAGFMTAAVAYAAFSFLQNVQATPHGGWDAFAVWNLHARYLYRGGAGVWGRMFDPAMSGSNPDYPLLLPGLVSGIWTVTGAEVRWAPALVAGACAALSFGMLFSAICALSQDKRGWLAGLLLLATPSYFLLAASQAADVPISLYMLSTVVLLKFAEAWPGVRRPMLVLAGLSAGFAAWTKNEGLLFVVAILASQFVSYAFLRNWRGLQTNLAILSLGLTPMLALLIGFKTLMAPARIPIDTFEHIASPARYGQIAWGFYDQIKGFGGTWHTFGIHPFVLMVLFFLLYVGPVEKITPTSLSLLLLMAFMLGGYIMVYLFSGYGNVLGYISNSLDRLYLQLWPVALFIVSTFTLTHRIDGFDE